MVAEAMASGVPCVVTDVGDSAMIVGDTGLVVPPSDPAVLALAWGQLLLLENEARKRKGAAARKKIEENFEIGVIVGRYQEFYEKLHREVSGHVRN